MVRAAVGEPMNMPGYLLAMGTYCESTEGEEIWSGAEIWTLVIRASSKASGRNRFVGFIIFDGDMN